MVFASPIFLYYFLPLFLGLYYTVPRGLRSLVIAIASYVFYGWWRPDFVLLMWFSTLVDFTAGRRITAARLAGGRGKPWLWLSLVVNLGLLGYFKYFNFGIDTLNAIFAPFGGPMLHVGKIVLPVGISFYTFQTLSYTIDVYRGSAAPVKSFQDFMCYVSLFPQLVAGPIVRYNTVAEQLHDRTHTRSKFYRGLLAFQAGMVKKVLIADVLGQLADQAFSGAALDGTHSWLGALAYTFQIYFDFSGYSDMAIGLGLMIGFQFPVNFDQPYRAISITDFGAAGTSPSRVSCGITSTSHSAATAADRCAPT
ncbi:MAG: MBOAT family O-acyltransferase [Planctomycetota bacterium]